MRTQVVLTTVFLAMLLPGLDSLKGAGWTVAFFADALLLSAGVVSLVLEDE